MQRDSESSKLKQKMANEASEANKKRHEKETLEKAPTTTIDGVTYYRKLKRM
jgi:hypothetical protein